MTSATGGISCPSSCTASVNAGTAITFTASLDSGASFVGWGDACAASGTAITCSLTVNADTTVSATFEGGGGGGPSIDELNDRLTAVEQSLNGLEEWLAPISASPGADDQWMIVSCNGTLSWTLRLRTYNPGCDGILRGSEFTPSTDLIPVNADYGFYPLIEINDGNTNPGGPPTDNGFVTDSPNGSILFTFDRDRIIEGFLLWNDVNVGNEGVRLFNLQFFDSNDIEIGSTAFFNAYSEVQVQEYVFGRYEAVRSVKMNIAESSWRIEIREVAFLARR